MNSIALARGGFYDGALAGAIGSQVSRVKKLSLTIVCMYIYVHIYGGR